MTALSSLLLTLVISPLVRSVSVVGEKWKTNHCVSTLAFHSTGLATAMHLTHCTRLLLLIIIICNHSIACHEFCNILLDSTLLNAVWRLIVVEPA
jgi:hypothetical protein